MNLTIFQFDSKNIRLIFKNGEPWFIASDVAKLLEIQNARQNVAKYPDSEKGVCSIYTPGGEQKLTIINEPGLYRMIFQSRVSEAEKFKTWVFSEVLPSIRKTGSYTLPKHITREDTKKVRKDFCQSLVNHGVTKPHEFIQITYAHKDGLRIPRKKKKDSYSRPELLMTLAAEVMTQFHIESDNLTGYKQIQPRAEHCADLTWQGTQGMLDESQSTLQLLEQAHA
jgi:prophage antirepressor-like protein